MDEKAPDTPETPAPQGDSQRLTYVLLVVLVLAAMLTPPDIVSQLCLAAPMLLLYEVGIQISRFVYKRKLKKEAKKNKTQ